MFAPTRFAVICCCSYHGGKGKGFLSEWGIWIHIGMRLGASEQDRLPRACEHGIPLPKTRGFFVRWNVRARRTA